ncbi:MAG: Large ribosomal RNA subunit accumulation protein YceD [Paracidovorax wautersii]|uniref:Large ribosomal RNA subunit accumulation protein YceD n=1 Tax=Paracidovorax wautersii TaxID=1177982 RepID=A0A7V8JPF0_9BURK|nr:MAG: Large ribosomal RNA subunit accumulation protein YceD [Paracidovorax wautersii]
MTQDYSPQALDVRAFAQAGGELRGADALSTYERLAQELPGQDGGDAELPAVRWSAHGRTVARAGAADEIWLDLQVQADVPQICQRCLQPVLSRVDVERAFHFVADERTAAELDEASDDDVLVISRQFDLHGLIEDEILMDLPLVPNHDVCPQSLPWQAQSEDFDAQEEASRPNPFAPLDVLKKKK